jgi:hypothetical protein
MASTTRLFRVFVSFPFNDFAVERNAPQAEIFPHLQGFCHRARFQAVDLRWGVGEEARRGQGLRVWSSRRSQPTPGNTWPQARRSYDAR